jgi:hypothetical protein
VKSAENGIITDNFKTVAGNCTQVASMSVNVSPTKLVNMSDGVDLYNAITYSDFYVNYNTYMVGADGHTITIARSDYLKQPTYNELIQFLKYDRTDEKLYTNEYVCADFAEDIQHNAAFYGYECGYVS